MLLASKTTVSKGVSKSKRRDIKSECQSYGRSGGLEKGAVSTSFDVSLSVVSPSSSAAVVTTR